MKCERMEDRLEDVEEHGMYVRQGCLRSRGCFAKRAESNRGLKTRGWASPLLQL